VRRAFAGHPGLVEGEQWYQSDHMVFVGNGVPAVALTSEHFAEIFSRFAHTASDLPELVDPAKLAETALALRDLLRGIEARFNH
jgi:aminopeptidase YwaD